MACKVGDTVRFLNDVGGGIVVRFEGTNRVVVSDSDGFEIPVLTSDVVVVSPSTNGEKENMTSSYKEHNSKQEPVNKPQPANKPLQKTVIKQVESNFPERGVEEYDVLFGFCPQNQTQPLDSGIELYLINDSRYYLLYSVGIREGAEEIRHIKGGELEPESKVLLKVLSGEDLNMLQQLSMGLILYRNGVYKLQEPEQLELALSPVKFFRSNAFQENDYFEERALLHKLLSSQKTLKDFLSPSAEDIVAAMKEKKAQASKPLAKKKEIAIEEVDLHIEFLVDNHMNLSNAEILDIQLSRFTTALDLGMRSGTKRMVFIHGVGNGRLKQEILRLLSTQYAGKLRYQDASFKEYGYGATMVLL